MPDANQFMLENCKSYNGTLSLPQTLEAFAQAVLEERGLFAYVQVGDTLHCKKCGAPFNMAETPVKTIVKHVESHQARTDQGADMPEKQKRVYKKGDRVYDVTQGPQRKATFINVLPADENLAKVELAPGEHELWSLDLLEPAE